MEECKVVKSFCGTCKIEKLPSHWVHLLPLALILSHHHVLPNYYNSLLADPRPCFHLSPTAIHSSCGNWNNHFKTQIRLPLYPPYIPPGGFSSYLGENPNSMAYKALGDLPLFLTPFTPLLLHTTLQPPWSSFRSCFRALHKLFFLPQIFSLLICSVFNLNVTCSNRLYQTTQSKVTA